MRRIGILLLCTLVACATAPRVRRPRPAEDRGGVEAPRPVRELRRMALGRLPRFNLVPVLLGTTPRVDQVVSGSGPAPYTLSIDASSSTNATPTVLQFSNFGSARVCPGDTANCMQAANGKQFDFYAYHGIRISGGRGTVTPMSYSSGGGGSADVSLEIIASATGGALKLSTSTTAGSAIKFSARATTTSPAAVAANVCANTAITITGVTANASCVADLPTGYASNLVPYCFVSAADTAQLRLCNVTAASITPTTGTYGCRCFNN